MPKIKRNNIKDSHDCPFYLQTVNSEHVCLFKIISNSRSLSSLTNEKITKEIIASWDKDCGGTWENCSIVPFFYDTEQVSLLANYAENYNPFENKNDDINKTSNLQEGNEVKNRQIKISVHQVRDPYLVKVDALMYPTNSGLIIDDDDLNYKSSGLIQKECGVYGIQTKMGEVYVTSNGGSKKIIPQKIYHAVVSGPSRLVVLQHIEDVVFKSVYIAEEEKNKTLAMLPCDCGTVDIEQVARIQLSALKTISNKENFKYLKNIYVIMQDKESYDSFVSYYNRIFK